MPELVRFLSEYASTHFLDEEKLMWMTDYKRLPEHRAIHEAMRLSIAQVVVTAEIAPEKALTEALGFLTAWLLEHICTEDQVMARHVRAQLA